MTDHPLSPEQPMASPAASGRRRPRMWIGATAAGLALVVGGAAAAGAARSDAPPAATGTATGDEGDAGTGTGQCAPGPGRPGGRGPGARGTVTAIDGATLTVETERGGTVTVTTTDETAVVETTEGDLADIAAGDTVRVMGRTGDDGTVSARAVVDVTAAREGADDEAPPEGEGGEQRGRRPGVAGTIESVDGTSFTVTTSDGETVTVTTDDDTAFAVTTALTVADIEVGDTIGVRGTAEEASEDTVTARGIVIGELGLGHHRGGPPPEGGPAPEDGPGEDEAPPTTN